LEEAPQLIAEGKRETAEEAKIRQLLEFRVPIYDVSEAECHAYYDSNAAQFRSPELMEASHILFAVDSCDSEVSEKARTAAQAVLAELSRQPSLFERLARERSDCSSKSGGGRLGQLAPGDAVPEFEAALACLEPGEIASAPVQTRFGFHILRLDARIAGKPLPYSYVHDKIAAFLGERRWRTDAAFFVARLVEAAQIEGVEMDIGKAAAA
jgi:peptidyl-prolyl cis-trans isomerase C